MRTPFAAWAGRLFLTAVSISPGAAVGQQEPAGFGESLEVEVVNVDVIVTDRSGRRVTDLGSDEFQLFVDGQPVAVDYFAPPAASPGDRELAAQAAEPLAIAPREVQRSGTERVRIQNEIEIWGERELDRQSRSVRALTRIVGALEAVEGRKALVLATAGYTFEPAQFLLQFFAQKLGANQGGQITRVPRLDELGPQLAQDFEHLVVAAENARVAFYTVSPREPPAAQNSAEFGSVGAGVKKGDDLRVPLAIRIPLSAITLLPHGTASEGRLELQVAICDADGKITLDAGTPIPVTVAEGDLERAKASVWVHRAELALAPGRHLVAVPVSDRQGGDFSTVVGSVNVVAP